MALQAKSGSTQIVHPPPSGKQLLLSCDKRNKKAATAPSKRESYLKQTQNIAATHTGRGADTVTCCSAAQKHALQLFKQPPLILYLSS